MTVQYHTVFSEKYYNNTMLYSEVIGVTWTFLGPCSGAAPNSVPDCYLCCPCSMTGSKLNVFCRAAVAASVKWIEPCWRVKMNQQCSQCNMSNMSPSVDCRHYIYSF